VEALSDINGVSLEEIERRACTIPDNTTDPDWQYRSFDGFLAPDESFKDVIKHDWGAVEVLGTSHSELAQQLRNIISAVEAKRKIHKQGPMATVTIAYSPCSERPDVRVVLEVSRNIFAGYQYSLFYNSSLERSVHNTKWNEEYIVVNTQLGLSIKISGNANVGIVDYIDRFGFYEGGDIRNPYRIDPHVLSAVITGKVTPTCLRLVSEAREAKLRELQDELDAASDQRRVYIDHAGSESTNTQYLISREESLSARIAEHKAETEKLLEVLKSHAVESDDLFWAHLQPPHNHQHTEAVF